ncbi:MAG: hypothetical protein KIT82_07020 [Bradyrhizobium sp.]|nr:hypothetical protein [Bradyrhizobium sp.]
MRRDPLVLMGSLGLLGLALWLVIAGLQEAAVILLRPLAPFVVWMMP